jgi:hypothetical protein
MHLIASGSNPDYLALLTKLPNENLIVEPEPRGKSPSIAFAGCHLYRRDSNSLMVHVAANGSEPVDQILQTNIGDIVAAAELPGSLVSLGVTRSASDVQGRALECGDCLSAGTNAFFGTRYHADQDSQKLASVGAQLLRPTRVNAWSVYALMEAYRNYCPVDFQIINEIARTWNRDPEHTSELYGKLSCEEIDSLLLSKVQPGYPTRNVFVRGELTTVVRGGAVSSDAMIASPQRNTMH